MHRSLQRPGSNGDLRGWRQGEWGGEERKQRTRNNLLVIKYEGGRSRWMAVGDDRDEKL
jgi:hypothetical protein